MRAWIKVSFAYLAVVLTIVGLMDFQFGTSVATGMMQGVALNPEERTEVLARLWMFCLFLGAAHLALQGLAKHLRFSRPRK